MKAEKPPSLCVYPCGCGCVCGCVTEAFVHQLGICGRHPWQTFICKTNKILFDTIYTPICALNGYVNVRMQMYENVWKCIYEYADRAFLQQYAVWLTSYV